MTLVRPAATPWPRVVVLAVHALPPPPPVIEPKGPDITVEAGGTIPVRAIGGADRYEWMLDGKGQISRTTGPAILYTAPEEGDVIAILTVTAYNDQGSSPPTSLTIIIIPPIAAATVRLDALAIPAGWMSGGGDPEP